MGQIPVRPLVAAVTREVGALRSNPDWSHLVRRWRRSFSQRERAAVSGTEDLTRTSAYWDSHVTQIYENRAEWLAHPLVKERLARLRGGQSLEDWVIGRYLRGRRIARAIGVGCGVASFELGLLELGAVERIDLYDVSQVALDTAMDTARARGVAERVRVFRQDINRVTLPPNTYDLVTFISSLHHVADLEGVLRRINGALTPQGLFFASEYVGPECVCEAWKTTSSTLPRTPARISSITGGSKGKHRSSVTRAMLRDPSDKTSTRASSGSSVPLE